MSDPYEEILAGEFTLRFAPGARHELICSRLQALLESCVAKIPTTKLLDRRAQVRVNSDNSLRPDLSLVTVATGKLLLAVEVINSDDHRTDTVTKKQIYEDIRVPRLWLVDPRYDNIEVYHTTEYGLKLMGMLAGRDLLKENLLPDFCIAPNELFAAAAPQN